MEISRSTISNNTTQRHGGGVAVDGANPVDIINSTISGNLAIANGGGVDVNAGLAVLRYVTVAKNTADQSLTAVGGGLADRGGSASMVASLFANNIEGNGAGINTTFDCATSGGVTSGGGNAYTTESACADIPDFVNVDAELGSLRFNGGLTKTHRIGRTSGARDTLEAADVNCSGLIGNADQRLVRRPQGAACDAGAYELAFCHGVVVNVVGTNGNDVALRGTDGNDGIFALQGNDTVNGLDGNDAICGGEGDDLLKGGSGRDALDGEDGIADDCRGGPDADQFFNCESVSE
jgi:hypothetical protein